jgi:hypothetical protein
MKTLFDRLKKDPYFKIESIKEIYPYSYANVMQEFKKHQSIYNCKLETINFINLLFFTEAYTVDLKKISSLFDE